MVVFSIVDQDVWFTDGYFDYVPHFLDGMAALPELAPANSDHLFHTISIITDISYAPGKVSYTTFDANGSEILRLTFSPASVQADGQPLHQKQMPDSSPGFQFAPTLNVIQLDRQGVKRIEIMDGVRE